MEKKIGEPAERQLKTGYDTLPERDQRVLRRIVKQSSITDDVKEHFHDSLSLGQRLAGRVAAFGRVLSFYHPVNDCSISSFGNHDVAESRNRERPNGSDTSGARGLSSYASLWRRAKRDKRSCIVGNRVHRSCRRQPNRLCFRQ